jgi:hypothetical protein
MSVTQVKQSVGSWNIRLRGNIPKRVLLTLVPFGHVAIVPGSVRVDEYGDNLLTAARYVGVFRTQNSDENSVTISGVGLESWLGDEQSAGDVFETPLELTAVGFGTAIAAALPPGGAITAGTIYSVGPGLYTGRHQWVTSRQVLDYITSIYGAEWRVNNNGTLDAGLINQLYATTPRAILVTKDDSSDLRYRALPGRASLGRESADYATRVVVLGEGEGETIQVGTADAPVVPYKDLHGNDVVITRVVSESFTQPTNVDARAQLILNEFGQPQAPSVNLSTSTYDIKGDVVVGDYIFVYDPARGFEDVSNEETWRGEIINPVKLRVVELSWPVRKGWTVAFRDSNGVWTDLSPYVHYEGGETNVVVGNLPRSLMGGGVTEPVGSRPVPDTSIPAAPAFLSWEFGAYQGSDLSTTKAAIRVTWSLPLNTDGSTIVDGSYYEIRYRVSEVLGYQVRWGAVSSLRWGQVSGNRWGAPISQAITADPEWIYMQFGWGVNEATILELTPGVTYEFQIRAVDAANPPHFGNFSTSEFKTTTGDLFAPSTPAAPVVAGNLVSIQVVHTLGKASGGTYNLEPDLVRLTVHVGGSASFNPSDENKVGELTANIGMMTAHTAAVGSFTIQPTETVHVKVVAIDRTGNKSSPSPSATVTAVLIDDQHVSSLSVSKLTAGTITANAILAAMIEVGSGGNVSVTEGAFHVKDALGNIIVRMGLLPDGKYGLRVDNPAGQPQIRAGELASGGYGLEAVDETGLLVSLSTLAFGTEAARQDGFQTIATTGAPDYNIVDPDGLKVRAYIGNSRRALLFIGAEISHALDNPAGTYDWRTCWMQVRVVDLTTGLESLPPGNTSMGSELGGNTGSAAIPHVPSSMQMGNSFLLETAFTFPTAPGWYEFQVYYSCPIGACDVGNRNIAVLPY